MKKYILLILPAITWGTLGLFVNNIMLSSVQIALWRTVLGSLMLFLIHILSGKKLKKTPINNNKFKLLLAGMCLGVNWVTLFEAYKYSSVAVATAVYYLAPAIMILLSPILFKEKLNFHKILALIGAVIGMALISFSAGIGQVSVIGIQFAFTGAIAYATIMLVNKSIKGLSGFDVAMIELAIAVIVLFAYCLSTGEKFIVPNNLSIMNLLIIGIVHTGICYGMYFSGVQKVKAQTSAICSFADPISAVLVSTFFLGEIMSIEQIFGTICIIGSAIFGEMGRKRK